MGVFSYCLKNGLEGGAKDDRSGMTLKSLTDYLNEAVKTYAEKEGRDQEPYSRVCGESVDFSLILGTAQPVAKEEKGLLKVKFVRRATNPRKLGETCYICIDMNNFHSEEKNINV